MSSLKLAVWTWKIKIPLNENWLIVQAEPQWLIEAYDFVFDH